MNLTLKLVDIMHDHHHRRRRRHHRCCRHRYHHYYDATKLTYPSVEEGSWFRGRIPDFMKGPGYFMSLRLQQRGCHMFPVVILMVMADFSCQGDGRMLPLNTPTGFAAFPLNQFASIHIQSRLKSVGSF